MSELYKKEYNEANEELYKKGYYVANMTDCFTDEYEIYDRDMQVVMDHLSLAQLIQLANLL